MRFPLPNSLSGRLVLLLFLALVSAQIFSLFIFAHQRHQLIENNVRDYMQDRTAAVVNLLERSPPEWHKRILQNSNRGRLRFAVFAQNPLANALEGELQRLQLEELPKEFFDAIQRKAAAKDRTLKSDRSVVAMSLPLSGGAWLLTVKMLPDPPRGGGTQSTLISLLFAVLLTVIVVWITSRWITRPLAQLASAAERLGRGEKTPALIESGPQDIRQTTHAFNQMRERLERFVSDRTRMLAAISHDMRTPLTALRLRAEFIEDSENRDKILATLDEIQAMTEATLAFAKNEHSDEQTRAVDLSALLDALCEDYRELGALGQQVEFTNSERVVYRCRPLAIKRALRNLIDNALAYGSQAQVLLSQTADGIKISIHDAGPGIAQADLSRVFDPFVRLEESRNRDTGGIGLGLPIARTLIHAHGGELRLSNHVQGGLEALINLPATPPDA